MKRFGWDMFVSRASNVGQLKTMIARSCIAAAMLATLGADAFAAVTWKLDGTTLKLIGDSAADWISVSVAGQYVYINGTNLKDAKGVSTPAPKSFPSANVAAIDIDGGTNNDTVEFAQTTDFQKQVRIFGQDGNDKFIVNFTSGKQATVYSDGGNGTDRADIPSNIGVGLFQTNAEMGTFGSYAGMGKSASLRVSPVVTSNVTNRSAALYTRAIQQFNVTGNSRYINTLPRCNTFSWDVTSAMYAEIPHWVDKTTDRPTEPDLTYKTARELDVNATIQWLANNGSTYGWKSTTAANAQDFANSGRPAIAIWKNPNGHGHIAVVRPTTAPFSATVGPAIAQAGGLNGSGNTESTTVKSGFNVGTTGPKSISDVIYYYHN